MRERSSRYGIRAQSGQKRPNPDWLDSGSAEYIAGSPGFYDGFSGRDIDGYGTIG